MAIPLPDSSKVGQGDAYSVEFFDLQIRFASKVAKLTGKPLGETIGTHTNIYVRLAMGRQLDESNAEWRRYLAGALAAPDAAAWTHALHLERHRPHAGPTPTARVGCFSYERIGADRARLHFHAEEADAPLSAQHRVHRLAELAALFARLKASPTADAHIVGASWLYNLRCYRALFPERYLESLRPVEHPYQRMPLWGQFLKRDRTVRPEAAARFLEDVAHAATVADLARCFPLDVLTTTAPARWFYEHVGL